MGGDSAGGNLALAVGLLAGKLGVRRPDAVVGFYPATNLQIDTFTPSRLLSFSDFLLNFSFLLTCLRAYVPA